MDPERTMEFLLQQAARADERDNRAAERMDRFEQELRVMARQGARWARRAFSAIDRNAEQIRLLGEQQKETEARLNAVIALVERKFGGNGSQPA
jgi:hypothetical protein